MTGDLRAPSHRPPSAVPVPAGRRAPDRRWPVADRRRVRRVRRRLEGRVRRRGRPPSSCRRRRSSPPGSSTAWLDGTIAPHAWTTIVEVVLGFAAGRRLGLVVGYGIARSRLVERLVSPYLVAAQAVPILALAPLLALWFGPGLLAKVVICGLIVFFPVADRDDGRDPLGRPRACSSSRRRCGRRRRQVLTDDRDPGRPARRSSAACGSAPRWRSSARSSASGRAPTRASASSSTSLAGACSTIPLLFATLATIALLGIVCYVLVVLAERRLVGLR